MGANGLFGKHQWENREGKGSHYGVCHQASGHWGPPGDCRACPRAVGLSLGGSPRCVNPLGFLVFPSLATHTSLARETSEAESLAHLKPKQVPKQPVADTVPHASARTHLPCPAWRRLLSMGHGTQPACVQDTVSESKSPEAARRQRWVGTK